MVKLKLVKARSYCRGNVEVTKENPFVEVSEAESEVLLKTGYFAEVKTETKIELDDVTVDDIASMKIADLRCFAEAKEIDLGGAIKKEEIISVITAWFENN